MCNLGDSWQCENHANSFTHLLGYLLELIQEDVTDESKIFPTTLERQVSGIIINCNSVVVELQEYMTKYGGDSRLKYKAGWAINGQGEVAKLRSNLEAHKAALELALDMLSLHVTKEIKNDTAEIRKETSAMKIDTAQILEEIVRLQQRLPKQGGNDYILQNFLEEMTTYTEKAMDGTSIDGGDSSTKAPSFVLETDEGSQRPSDAAYLSDWELDSAASDQVAYKLKMKRWEEQQNEERLAEAKLKDPILHLHEKKHKEQPGHIRTQDSYYVEVETFYGRLVINWPMPTVITGLLSEDYYIESSCNSFTALMCTAQEFPSQKDTLRPKRFLKPRDIKVIFYISITAKTTSSCFKHQWEFITTAVAGLTRRLELGGDVPPPWHNIVIVVEGPPRWDDIHPEIEIILTKLGILYQTDSLVTKVDGVVLDPPYHKDHCKIFGKPIYGTIHEYTVQPTIRPQHTCTKSIMGTEPLQVIAVAPQWSQTNWASHKPALSHNWAAAFCEVLKPEFIMPLPEHQIRAILSPGEFLKGVWTCQIRFRTSKHEQINQCVLTSPDQFQADRKKMITRSEGARGFARRLFGKS
ncbi:hypothetical protein FAGAP_8000 [Fusarium agapanthi]|uniref:Uncharacterized protein n=1 Tax=Fusarium agapanthi TaxID=1803897 RepID=A0A9P5B4U3_9HYPO|nr:hypothetical protein FAGAP_8000 [Fusarium agapanthi]